MPTRILALDTATEACSAALMFEDNLLLERFAVAPREHAKLILPMVDSLLKEAGITLDSLDALAFSRGPGSFTGVRIGIGIAQGLALGVNLPVIGVSTLKVLAQGAWRKTGACQVLTAIDARMGEVYWAAYRRQAAGVWFGETCDVVVTPEDLSALSANLTGCWATAGTGWQAYPTLLYHDGLHLVAGKTLLPSAKDMLPLALHQYHHGGAQSVVMAEPTYLRNKIAWEKLSSNVRSV
ncbi:tRNA (adenosine(37)-N6)-threonylcarbamoyltransferase complex dimerization subunit type 1 TsaB [Sodalis endosymbiont of Henestaris halophilus]|uniref:tRNA (adenosine(37)-N6)-threonylcarbamoyltransferase complex dimerization subunit type 1 TsaB n=1 Tax=Sodalis endosymbiont of Henestaris halophilus TaxID=1929246 RepID=UPI000BC0D839|nr:tRNA (adenosine(37)-N6)-threonylcarbamoyltransferase complex dimerization subunit type 1 TsaB [Sodalis endosymbiont of Henestaris halophilus]SNC58728.1 tRNA threonylcarbamoyladenosine biosynthesis protein TsaB [Sodalis endosymbiont of Henestaris halophilus]